MHVGIYIYVYTFFKSSSVMISGDNPPCTQRNCPLMSAANGRQSKASMQQSYTSTEYFILPKTQEPQPLHLKPCMVAQENIT